MATPTVDLQDTSHSGPTQETMYKCSIGTGMFYFKTAAFYATFILNVQGCIQKFPV